MTPARPLLAGLLLLLAAASLALPAPGAETGRGVAVRALEGEHGGPIYRQSWALVVGINTYPAAGPMRTLSFAATDARAVRDLLVQHYGFAEANVALLLDGDATRERILRELAALADKAGVDDRVIVYFSGHGHTLDLPGGGKRGYLIPAGARLSLADLSRPGRVETECVPMTEIRQKALLMAARHKLFLIDACYGGLAISGRGAGDVPYYLKSVAFRPMLGIIAGGRAGEEALESPEIGHGAFTKKLLDALTPVHGTLLADTQPPGQPDGVVTASELAAYLKTSVPQLTQDKQHPDDALDEQQREGQLLFFPTGEGAAQGAPAGPGTPGPSVAQGDAAPPPRPDKGQSWTNTRDGMEFVFVPAGPFTMGSDDGLDNEKPKHTVNLPAYWIGKNEVTVAQYRKFVLATGHKPAGDIGHWGKDERLPVVNVSWGDAVAYCQWAGCRLPTEAEWEKAARGTEGRVYPWGNQWDGTKCSGAKDNLGPTTPVGTYPAGASPYGCLDMAGNVWEWTSTLFDPYPYRAEDGRENPEEREDGLLPCRVLRGGCYEMGTEDRRTTRRLDCVPDAAFEFVGFRVARSAQ